MKPRLTDTNLPDWLCNLMVIVSLHQGDANRIVSEEARAARKGWGKREDVTTRRLLKLLERSRQPAQALREALNETSFEV